MYSCTSEIYFGSFSEFRMRSRDGNAMSNINFVSLRVKVYATATYNLVSISSYITTI